MNVAVPPAPSGLPAVDRQWGGLAVGRTYLLVGRAGAGRSALALQTVQAAVEDGTKCLLISPRAPESLVETAHGVGLNPAQAHAEGLLRLLRIPPAVDLAKRGADGLAKSYRDLVGLVEADRPGRVVIEDFTPLVQFDTFERFREAFSRLVSDLRDLDATLVVGLGDPANDASRRLLDVVGSLVDGTIQLSATGNILLKAPPVSEPESPADPPPAASETEPSEETRTEEAARPEPPAAPVVSTSDGASVETEPPRPPAPATAPEPVEEASVPATQAAPQPLVAVEPEVPALAASGPPPSDVVPPPPADPDLLLPSGDTFGFDPADAIMEQGFLADSSAGISSAAPRSGRAPSFPLPADQPFAPPPPSAPLPAFAPLGGAPTSAPSPADTFRAHLAAAFQSRALGTPFLVVATRMDPAQPEAAHFPTVEAGLRSALREDDHILGDAERKRAVVLLPASGAEAGQALFARLQAHLRSALGDQAEPVLAAIGAVTIPDGQPFASAQDLLAYAFEG